MAFKRCRTCGRGYETEADWLARTVLAGSQPTYEDDGGELRLRICRCGNTLAVLHRDGEAVPTETPDAG